MAKSKIKLDSMLAMVGAGIEESPEHKLLLPIGACLDVCTGIYEKTKSGKYFLNGGLGATTGFTAKGNSFKSAIINYMLVSAGLRMWENIGVWQGIIYDTEVTLHWGTVRNTINNVYRNMGIPEEDRVDPIDSKMLVITDATKYSGNKFISYINSRLEEKVKAKIFVDTPLLNADGTVFKTYWPWLTAIDSLSDWKSDRVETKEEKTEIGDSEANTLYMTGGLDKYRLLGALNVECAKYSNYMLMTAQLGKKNQMGNKYQTGDGKDLAAMGADEKITGVSGKFMYSLANSWKATGNSPLDMPGTGGKKTPRYPRDSSETNRDVKDMFRVTIRILRSKSSASFTEETIIVSQRNGVEPTLTEFYRLDDKLKKKYGMIGNDQNYSMVLYPNVKLSRTTIVRKTEADHRLRRAINITSEMSQIVEYHKQRYLKYIMPPEELYQKLIDLGYDWDKILDTKGYYTVGGYEPGEEPISTLTLLAMAIEELVVPELKKDYIKPQKRVKKTPAKKGAK